MVQFRNLESSPPPAVAAFIQGRLSANRKRDEAGNVLSIAAYTYDARSRMVQVAIESNGDGNGVEPSSVVSLTCDQRGQEDGLRADGLSFRYHGIDGVMRNPTNGRLVIIEAKGGGSGALGYTNSGQQLSRDWIEKKLDDLAGRDPLSKSWARELKRAQDAGTLDVLSVHTPIHSDTVGDPKFVLKNIAEIIGRFF